MSEATKTGTISLSAADFEAMQFKAMQFESAKDVLMLTADRLERVRGLLAQLPGKADLGEEAKAILTEAERSLFAAEQGARSTATGNVAVVAWASGQEMVAGLETLAAATGDPKIAKLLQAMKKEREDLN